MVTSLFKAQSYSYRSVIVFKIDIDRVLPLEAESHPVVSGSLHGVAFRFPPERVVAPSGNSHLFGRRGGIERVELAPHASGIRNRQLRVVVFLEQKPKRFGSERPDHISPVR